MEMWLNFSFYLKFSCVLSIHGYSPFFWLNFSLHQIYPQCNTCDYSFIPFRKIEKRFWIAAIFFIIQSRFNGHWTSFLIHDNGVFIIWIIDWQVFTFTDFHQFCCVVVTVKWRKFTDQLRFYICYSASINLNVIKMIKLKYYIYSIWSFMSLRYPPSSLTIIVLIKYSICRTDRCDQDFLDPHHPKFRLWTYLIRMFHNHNQSDLLHRL